MCHPDLIIWPALLFGTREYSPNTTRAYSTHRRSYLAFCSVLGIPPVPADPVGLCLYVAVLARTLKYTSIKQYMNIVRILHLEWGLPNPLANNYQLSCVLLGIRRHIGDRPHRKTPPSCYYSSFPALICQGWQIVPCGLPCCWPSTDSSGLAACSVVPCSVTIRGMLRSPMSSCIAWALTSLSEWQEQYNLQSACLSSPYRVSQVMSCVPPKPWLSTCSGQPCHAPWENPLCPSSWRHPLGNPWLPRPSPAACGTWPTLPATRTQCSEDTLSGGAAPAWHTSWVSQWTPSAPWATGLPMHTLAVGSFGIRGIRALARTGMGSQPLPQSSPRRLVRHSLRFQSQVSCTQPPSRGTTFYFKDNKHISCQ